MNRLHPDFGMYFRLDAEKLTLRGEDFIVRQCTSRRFQVHEQPRPMLVSPSREGSSLGTRRTRAEPCSEEQGYEAEQTMTLGWSISALLHGLVLAVVAVFNLYMTSSRVTPQKEPFRWDVSLMAAPRTQVVVADGSQEPFQAVETFPEKTGERTAEPSVQSVALPQQAERAQMVSSPNRTYQRRPALEETAEKTEGFNRATAMFVHSPVASVLPPPDIESQTDSKLVQIKTKVENPPVLQRPQRVTRTISNKAVLPDYGWLMGTLRTKLELVKTYPALAKAKHWQGRVVVQVSIERHGRIVNPEIEESSGNPVLDRAAMEALRAASPLTLAHDLEGGPVVMLVPLNYQLE